ncbi:MAG: type II toxin-antitoxin system HicB family antitoxin [Chloroflexi bacterium]|nr:type II toxin-antitoxin system HicB family antitoxin [Chloroflexota bacterium]
MKFQTLQAESFTILDQPFWLARTVNLAGRGITKLLVTLEEDEDGFIVASCPTLPGCHSQGRTKKEAIANIREAIQGYIASMRKHGEPIPCITEVEEVEVVV